MSEDARSRVSAADDVSQEAAGRDAAVMKRVAATFVSLRNRDFMYLWIGTLLMMGGMQMQMVATGYLTYDITDSPFLLGLVNAGFAVPMLALALFGGAIADRMERKRVIQLGQGAAGLIALFVAVSITTDTVSWVHLFVASMFQGALFSFLIPARQAIIPSLVGRENLNNAMALSSAAMSITTLVAPAAAGVLYARIGPDGVFVIVILMNLAAVGIMIVLGLGDAVRRSLMMALIMEQVSDEYRGRVMSVFMMSFGLMPLGVLPAALVAEFVGAREAAGMLGFLLLLTTALIFATQRQLRELV